MQGKKKHFQAYAELSVVQQICSSSSCCCSRKACFRSSPLSLISGETETVTAIFLLICRSSQWPHETNTHQEQQQQQQQQQQQHQQQQQQEDALSPSRLVSAAQQWKEAEVTWPGLSGVRLHSAFSTVFSEAAPHSPESQTQSPKTLNFKTLYQSQQGEEAAGSRRDTWTQQETPGFEREAAAGRQKEAVRSSRQQQQTAGGGRRHLGVRCLKAPPLAEVTSAAETTNLLSPLLLEYRQ
ncbi:hypothetical protein Efla_006432 [Eimeria flavescens]